jgi:hypothetical protein
MEDELIEVVDPRARRSSLSLSISAVTATSDAACSSVAAALVESLFLLLFFFCFMMMVKACISRCSKIEEEVLLE